MAEGVGFEPTEPFGSPVFKTGAIDHSTTPPVLMRRGTGYGGTVRGIQEKLSKDASEIAFFLRLRQRAIVRAVRASLKNISSGLPCRCPEELLALRRRVACKARTRRVDSPSQGHY